MLPPPAPRIFYGRDELIDGIVRSVERLTSIALIGAGGIGKTSVFLTVLHDDRIKRRFGQNCGFIRCDEFPASRAHFLRRLSKVVGAGIENPEDLCSLRPFLSSKEILIVLDNAESVLDPQGSSAREIYAVVDELTRFNNLCVCITSRISTFLPHCKTIHIPTLSAQAAQDTFHRIYKRSERTSQINYILEKLDHHPLSITLLATVARHHRWNTNQLTKEWESWGTRLRYSGSLGTTVSLSLASPAFRELGPRARQLLEVVAFFPQGINEENTNWLFSNIPDVLSIFETFCVLSLTYRNDGFVTMLTPLRDHLRPKDPASSALLRATKERYFARLAGDIKHGQPGFDDARWITSEDVNVEHLLEVFATIDANSKRVWDVCSEFMAQLYWHKPRLVMLGPKIEALPDNHPSKLQCLVNLSRLFDLAGNLVERKWLLGHSLHFWREQGNDFQVAQTLRHLSIVNRQMGLHEEGTPQAEEACRIFGRLGSMVRQAECLINLTWSLCDLAAAEEAGSRAIDLLPEKCEEPLVCEAHRALGDVYQRKGETKKAIHHFETALGIASSLNMADLLFWANLSLAELFSEQGKFEDAQTRLEHAKSYAVNDAYFLARVMEQQAWLWDLQGRFGDARLEALRALEIFDRLGAVNDADTTRQLLHQTEPR